MTDNHPLHGSSAAATEIASGTNNNSKCPSDDALDTKVGLTPLSVSTCGSKSSVKPVPGNLHTSTKTASSIQSLEATNSQTIGSAPHIVHFGKTQSSSFDSSSDSWTSNTSSACSNQQRPKSTTPSSPQSSGIMKTKKQMSQEGIMDKAHNSATTSAQKTNSSVKLPPRRMLIAVDGSAYSEMAFDWYMNNLRDERRDVLVLLNVSNSVLSMPIHAGVDIPQRSFDAFNDARRSSSSQILTDVIELYEDKAQEAGLDSAAYELVHINDSNTGKAICKYAKHNNIDHVIMGTRGYSKLRKKFLGSVSDYVLNNCNVSTTIVRQSGDDKNN